MVFVKKDEKGYFRTILIYNSLKRNNFSLKYIDILT